MPSALLPPPYTLAHPDFPYRALATLAARAPLGGHREAALACYVAARLAHELSRAQPLGAETRAARAVGARSWLASLALPAALRVPLARLVDATGPDGSDADASLALQRGRAATALAGVHSAAAAYLDPAARSELEQLERLLAAAQAP